MSCGRTMSACEAVLLALTMHALFWISDVAGATLPTTPTAIPTDTTDTTTTSTNINGGLCSIKRSFTDLFVNDRLKTLEAEFQPPEGGDYKRQLDLVFIVDRSLSIGDYHFEFSKDLINLLLTRLAEMQYIFIHRDYTRVAVISFAEIVTINIDGVSVGKLAVDACSVTESISNIHLNKTFTNSSQIQTAMRRAKEIFNKASAERLNSDQILWMFYDGECNPKATCHKELEQLANEMRIQDVKIFTAGVGVWITSQQRELRIQSLAFDESHYACAWTWRDIVRNMTGQPHEQRAPLYNEIPSQDHNRCGTCREGFECACEVIKREYMCTNETVVLIEPEQPRPTTPLIVFRDGRTDPSWLLPVAIGSSVGGGILLLILLIALPILAAKRRRERKEEERFLREEQPIYDGPPLPPPIARPPRPPRPMQRNETDDEAVYANTVDLKEVGLQRPLEYENDNSGNFEDSTVYNAISYPQEYVNIEDMEHDMDQWAGHLALVKNSNKLNHLAVRSLAKDRWAHTANSPVSERDFREMENLMRGARRPDQKLKIGDKSYEVDRENLLNHQLHATRFVRRGLKEVVWVSKVYDYVIVGMANDSEDENCVRAVYDIHNYLKELMEREGRHNIRSGTEVEEGIYNMELPTRYSRGPRYGNAPYGNGPTN